jgi:hypothetical protein
MRIYTSRTRARIRTDVALGKYRLTAIGQAVVNYIKYREQAHWLVGSYHPAQKAN